MLLLTAPLSQTPTKTMPRSFYTATAEQVISAVQAAVATARPVDSALVASFTDLSPTSAEAALNLAVDLGLLSENNGTFTPFSPLCHFAQTPKVAARAALLRIALESYEPFIVFRRQLRATGQAGVAATQTRALLDLDAHRDDISQTLIDLGTFAQAIKSEGGGHHLPIDNPLDSHVLRTAGACEDLASAEAQVREHLGRECSEIVSHAEVVLPLAQGLLRASGENEDDAAGAIMLAGNSVESYLVGLAQRQSVSLSGATGINTKVDRLAQAGKVPAKVQGMGRYLAQIRNGADHGIDPEIGVSWTIRSHTAHEYLSVAMTFISACDAIERGAGYFL